MYTLHDIQTHPLFSMVFQLYLFRKNKKIIEPGFSNYERLVSHITTNDYYGSMDQLQKNEIVRNPVIL